MTLIPALKKNYMLIPISAALLLLLCWLFGKHPVLHTVFAVLSFLCSVAGLLEPLIAAVKARKLVSGPILPVAAGLLSILTGASGSAAFMLLLWLLVPQLIERMRNRWQSQLQRRLEANPVKERLPKLQPKPLLSHREQFLHLYFPYLILLLAALMAVLTAVSSGSAAKGLGRAAEILALGSASSFFSGYSTADYAAAIRAGEQGVIFQDNSLARALQTKLCCTSVLQPKMVEGSAVYPIAGDAELLMSMAANTMSVSDFSSADKLYSIRQSLSPSESKALKGFGAVSSAGSHVLLTGSAELMNKSGLPLLPFRDGDGIVHIGVDGKYAGCIDLMLQPLLETEALLEAAGFYCFRDEAEAAEKRLSGEHILFISPSLPAQSEEGDLNAVSGGGISDGDILILRHGKAGVAVLLENLANARLMRKNLLLAALSIKVFALLLAIFGFCPIWFAAVLELGSIAFGDFYAVRALRFKGKYGL